MERRLWRRNCLEGRARSTCHRGPRKGKGLRFRVMRWCRGSEVSVSTSGKSGEMSGEDCEIRAARLDEKDIEAIVYQRRAMFFDMGHRDERALESMSERFRPWLKRKMEAGEYVAWFAIAPDESVAAGAGLWLM